MPETTATSPAAPTGDNGGTEKRWPAIYALFTAGIRPATTAARTNHVRLVDAGLVHLIPLVLALFVLLVIDYANVGRLQPQRPPASEVLLDSAKRLIREAMHDPLDTALPFVILLGPIDVAIFLLAICLMPWGARREPITDSLRHAVRRTWLHCGHAGMLVAFVALIHVILLHVRPEWLRGYSYVDNSSSPSFAFRYAEEIESLSIILAAAWFAWALFRALGADRPVRPPVYVPKCLGCGYNLTGLPPGHCCPECGRPMLIPDPDPSASVPAAQLAAVRDWDRGYWRTTFAWMRHPKAAAIQPCFSSRSDRHKRYLMINLVICGVMASVGYELMRFCLGGGTQPKHSLVTIASYGAGCFLMLLYFTSAASLVVVLVEHLALKQSELRSAFQAVCYNSWWLPVWTALGAYFLAAWDSKDNDCMPFDERIPTLVIVVSALISLGVLVRASAGVRYACR